MRTPLKHSNSSLFVCYYFSGVKKIFCFASNDFVDAFFNNFSFLLAFRWLFVYPSIACLIDGDDDEHFTPNKHFENFPYLFIFGGNSFRHTVWQETSHAHTFSHSGKRRLCTRHSHTADNGVCVRQDERNRRHNVASILYRKIFLTAHMDVWQLHARVQRAHSQFEWIICMCSCTIPSPIAYLPSKWKHDQNNRTKLTNVKMSRTQQKKN